MTRSRAVSAVFILLLAIVAPVSARVAGIHRAAYAQTGKAHRDALAQEDQRHRAALAREEKRHAAVLAKHQAALLRVEKRHQAALARHQAALARQAKKHQIALAKHQAALARRAKKHQIALARHQAALAKHQAALAKHQASRAEKSQKHPGATAQADKKPTAVAQAPRKHHTVAARGNAGFVKWLREYYRNEGLGWETNDVSKILARTTSDYQYIDAFNRTGTRDEMLTEYTQLLSRLAEKNTRIHTRITLLTASLSGGTATVLCSMNISADRKLDDGQGDTASLFGRMNRIKLRDTWVHLSEGWYLARTQEIANGYNMDITGHIDQ